MGDARYLTHSSSHPPAFVGGHGRNTSNGLIDWGLALQDSLDFRRSGQNAPLVRNVDLQEVHGVLAREIESAIYLEKAQALVHMLAVLEFILGDAGCRVPQRYIFHTQIKLRSR